MNVHAVTVSVDYSAELARGLDRWVAGLASLIVVTAPRDEATIALARGAGARLHITEAFYEDGAWMNKGRAIEEARALLPATDWHLFLDADVAPPVNWHDQVMLSEPRSGVLHGARRAREDGTLIDDHELAGFFHLFHSSDPRAAAPLERDFVHAGNYDSLFLRRWPRNLQRILPLTLAHYGETGVNWCGKGKQEVMREIRQQRRFRDWRRETIR